MLGVLRLEREQLGRTIQYVPPETWGNESPFEGWSIRQVLAHLAAGEAAGAAIIGDEAASEVEEYRKGLGPADAFDPKEFHRSAVQKRDELSWIELAAEWGRAADLLLSRASELSEDDWGTKVLPWIGGDLKAGYLAQARVAEWWVHGEDIRAGAGLPPRREHPPIFCTNDLAVRLIPFALAAEGHEFKGASVGIELEHVGEGTWHQSLDHGGDVPTEKKPDAWITGRAHAFALVAAERADVDVCLYDGVLNVGGDPEIGETVLRSLRAYV